MQVESVAEAVETEFGGPVTMTVEQEQVAQGRVAPVVDKALVEQLGGQARGQGLAIDGEGGLLAQLTKLVVESALEGEITDHLA